MRLPLDFRAQLDPSRGPRGRLLRDGAIRKQGGAESHPKVPEKYRESGQAHRAAQGGGRLELLGGSAGRGEERLLPGGCRAGGGGRPGRLQ